MPRPSITVASIGATIAAAGTLASCGGVVDREPNLIAGKEAFVEKCGSCHILNRAGTKGITGPNLDTAFEQAIGEGMKRSTMEGVIARQIEIPNRRAQVDPVTGKELSAMPADLVKGRLVHDVAAYVAYATGRGGEDPGRLADVGVSESKGTAKPKDGILTIPADPGGGLVYEFADAEATPGDLEIKSPNESGVDHNIALEGQGVNEEGPVVKNGDSSDIMVTVKAGDYTFYCSVPGHREGGMEGALSVK